MKTVHDLVYKRGFVKDERQRRVALNDNEIVQKNLGATFCLVNCSHTTYSCAYVGKYDVVCVEDIIHHIFTCGPQFKRCSNFLWPFKLSNPKGGWRKKKTHFVEGGDFGNREDQINALIAKML